MFNSCKRWKQRHKVKNLKKLIFKFLEITINHAKNIKFIDLIVVNSDHKKILNKSLKLNVKSVKRSKILSGDHVSDYSIISSTIENLKKIEL